LVGTLAFSTAAAVLTKAAAMFLRMFSLVMIWDGIVYRMLSPAEKGRSPLVQKSKDSTSKAVLFHGDNMLVVVRHGCK
jgi:hypothetical protein